MIQINNYAFASTLINRMVKINDYPLENCSGTAMDFGYGNKLCCPLLKPQGCAQFFEEDLSQCSGLAIDTGNAGKWCCKQ